MAKGQYVTFLDSDDAVLPTHFDIVSSEYAADADLLVCDYGNGRISDGVLMLHSEEAAFVRKEDPVAASYIFNNYAFVERLPFFVWNKFFKRSIIEKNNIRFDESVSLGEDSIFLFQYLLFATKIVHHNVKTYLFLPWENIIHLSFTIRTPAEYLHCYKLNFLGMKSMVELAGEAAERRAVDLGISRVVTAILYNFTTWKNRRTVSCRELIRFTDTEIVPFLRTIDVTRFHARDIDVRFVYNLLMQYGGNVAIAWCWLTSPIRSVISFVSSVVLMVKWKVNALKRKIVKVLAK